jgi:hypothetical protein
MLQTTPASFGLRMIDRIVGVAADSTERDARTVGLAMLFALGIGSLAAICWNPSFWAAALMWASASTAVGLLLGFLFGIPRSLAKSGLPAGGGPSNGAGAGDGKPDAGKPDASQTGDGTPVAGASSAGQTGGVPPVASQSNAGQPADGQSKTPAGVNTNLEEISDWLTKIIVGVSLVELTKALAQLQKAADLIAQGLGGRTQESFAYALMVYFSISGFLGSYLLTRLYLQKAFRQASE